MGAMEACLATAAAGSMFLGTMGLTSGHARRVRETTPGWMSGIAESAATIPVVRESRRRAELDRRRSACLRELPGLIDVLTLGLMAGLSFDASLELYLSRYDTELSAAFGEAMTSWRMGISGRGEALEALAGQMGVSALGSFASIVSQALEFGSPLADALEAQAQVIRDEQRSELEEEIERVPVKMLVPLGTLIVPAMLLAILGPLLSSSLGTV